MSLYVNEHIAYITYIVYCNVVAQIANFCAHEIFSKPALHKIHENSHVQCL